MYSGIADPLLIFRNVCYFHCWWRTA